VPLVLSSNVLFLYDQVTKIRSSQTSGVVTTMTGKPLQNSQSYNRTRIAPELLVRIFHGIECSLRCLNGSSAVQIMKHACSVLCSECFPLVTAINYIDIRCSVLDCVYVFQTATRYYCWYRISDHYHLSYERSTAFNLVFVPPVRCLY